MTTRVTDDFLLLFPPPRKKQETLARSQVLHLAPRLVFSVPRNCALSLSLSLSLWFLVFPSFASCLPPFPFYVYVSFAGGFSTQEVKLSVVELIFVVDHVLFLILLVFVSNRAMIWVDRLSDSYYLPGLHVLLVVCLFFYGSCGVGFFEAFRSRNVMKNHEFLNYVNSKRCS